MDADFERLIEIDLPLVTLQERLLYEGTLKGISLPISIGNIRETTFGEFEFMGDFHYGAKTFSRPVLNGYLKYLADNPHIQIGLMGDIIEYGQGSRFIKEDEGITIDEQIRLFVSDFKPFADRIKFILWGNHEERHVRKSESKQLIRTMVLELGLDPDKDLYVGEPQKGVFIVFKAGDKRYGCQAHHSKTGAKVNQDIQLRRTGSQNLVSIIAHGHTHRLTWKPRTFRALEVMDGQIVNVVRRQYLLATGCFLKYPGYAEAASMPYTEVGSPIVRFYSEINNLSQYDLTGSYRQYLTRGGLSYNSPQIKLSTTFETAKNTTCPRCGSYRLYKHGKRRGKQRYQCEDCGRTTIEN